MPYSPLGKGFLTGKIDENTSFDSGDIRNTIPRFTPEARIANQALIDLIGSIAQRKDATPAQIALAWLLAQKPWIVPIPGTTKLHRLEENIRAVAVELTPDDLHEIESAAAKITIQQLAGATELACAEEGRCVGRGLDAEGKIAWGRGDISGDPLVVALTQSVLDSHLAGLRQDGVFYIFAGEREIDLLAPLETLNQELGIRRLLLEGGGAANGTLLRAGLIDELSLIIAPSVEGISGGPTVFDIHGRPGALGEMGMVLESGQVLEGGFVWLRYRFSWGR